MAKNRQLDYKYRQEKEKNKELERRMEETKCVSTVENLVSQSKCFKKLNILKFCRESKA